MAKAASYPLAMEKDTESFIETSDTELPYLPVKKEFIVDYFTTEFRVDVPKRGIMQINKSTFYTVTLQFRDQLWTFKHVKDKNLAKLFKLVRKEYPMVVFSEFPHVTGKAGDNHEAENRRVKIEFSLREVFAVPSIREDPEVTKFLASKVKRIRPFNAKQFKIIDLPDVAVIKLDIFCLDLSKSMKASHQGVKRFEKAIRSIRSQVTKMRIALQSNPNDILFVAFVGFAAVPALLRSPCIVNDTILDSILKWLERLKSTSGTAIFRACDLCTKVGKEFAQQLYNHHVDLKIFLYSDAFDNKSKSHEKERFSDLANRMGKGKKGEPECWLCCIVFGADQKTIQEAKDNLKNAVIVDAGKPMIDEQIFEQRNIRDVQIKEGILQDHCLFGVDINTIMFNQRFVHPELKIPIFMKETFDFVKNNCTEDGLFRVPANAADILEYRRRINAHEPLNWTVDQVCTAADIIKLFLHELPNPLMTFERYGRFIVFADKIIALETKLDLDKSNLDVQQNLHTSNELRTLASELKTLVDDIPIHSHNLLKAVLKMALKVVSQSQHNRMSAENMGRMCGQSLIRCNESLAGGDCVVEDTIDLEILKKETENAVKANSLVCFMIRYADILFEEDVKPEEVPKSKTMGNTGNIKITPADRFGALRLSTSQPELAKFSNVMNSLRDSIKKRPKSSPISNNITRFNPESGPKLFRGDSDTFSDESQSLSVV